jgi:hypothetical protein
LGVGADVSLVMYFNTVKTNSCLITEKNNDNEIPDNLPPSFIQQGIAAFKEKLRQL